MDYTEVVFDVETKKLFYEIAGNNPGDLGVSLLSVYSRRIEVQENNGRMILKEMEGKMQSFWEKDIPEMWPLFQNADRIIGFNSIGFDVPALLPYATFPFAKLPHFDILQKFKESVDHRISLNAIAKETLGTQKNDSGIAAVEYFKKGDKKSLAKLKKYCEMDVAITRDIYDFGFNEGYLNYKDKWNTERHAKVDFSYPKQDNTKQIGLF